MQNQRECDVLVVGSGPAGSTIASLLAEKGKHVIVLKKERFLRFHIGEGIVTETGLRELLGRVGFRHGSALLPPASLPAADHPARDLASPIKKESFHETQ